jgi:Phage terminase, small subunit
VANEAKKNELAEADYVSGMKYKDIAEKYGVSINTVKSWKKRYAWCREGAHKNKKGCTQNDGDKISVKEPLAEEVVEVMENDGLTDKQRLFCIHYIRCFNATKAYQKAYQCGYDTAMVNGFKMLRNAKIKNEIHKLKQNRLNREMLSEEDVVQMYINILYADIGDYLDKKHNMINLSGPCADGRLIKKVSFGKTDSIELMDKMAALKWLADHMDLATERQRAEIELLRAKAARQEAGNDGQEEKGDRQRAKDNIASILEQMHEIQDGDTFD